MQRHVARYAVVRYGVAVVCVTATVILDLAPALPPVVADRVLLQQVLINFVMNGIEAMAPIEDRPRELMIRSQVHDEDHVLVAVQDAGATANATHGATFHFALAAL